MRMLPCWPAIFMPLNTRAGVAHAPIEPGRTVLLVVTVRRALALEVVALHRAGEALALADAGDVDPLARGEHVGADHLADLEAREVVDPQLGEVARRGASAFLR